MNWAKSILIKGKEKKRNESRPWCCRYNWTAAVILLLSISKEIQLWCVWLFQSSSDCCRFLSPPPLFHPPPLPPPLPPALNLLLRNCVPTTPGTFLFLLLLNFFWLHSIISFNCFIQSLWLVANSMESISKKRNKNIIGRLETKQKTTRKKKAQETINETQITRKSWLWYRSLVCFRQDNAIPPPMAARRFPNQWKRMYERRHSPWSAH